jgi:hypothetical protein
MLSEPSIPVANERHGEPRFESNHAPAESSVIDGACVAAIPSTVVDLSGFGAVDADLAETAAILRAIQLVERRREVRYPTHDQAEVEVMYSAPLRLSATVLDISRSGLRLELNTLLGKGQHVKIVVGRQLVVFGEVRYCRRAGDGFQAGILIEDLFYPRPQPEAHIHDDDLGLYLIGKGLTVHEVIKLRDHLVTCELCRARLFETSAVLNPAGRSKLPGAAER